ncbi:hypothetical protein [Streptomyces sp. TLI_171]|nr:hypothetical protein [Streptomyces sp. TLI_171]RKE16870.1 hypothetical protein BX266_0114 [Streptomyces sp. TLI_171]
MTTLLLLIPLSLAAILTATAPSLPRRHRRRPRTTPALQHPRARHARRTD